MKKLLYFFAMVVFSASGLAQQLVDGFDSAPSDTNYWRFIMDYKNQGDSLVLNYETNLVKVGPGALEITYRTSGWESWGEEVVMDHWNQDPTQTYDFSGYDSISFWYYNEVPADTGFDFLLRFNLFDVSNSPNGNNTYSYQEIERYFSFHHIMTTAPGWHYVSIPLVNNGDMNGNGFALEMWGGTQYGNGTLDLDKIKGWSLEFNMNEQTTKIARGKIIIDDLRLKGAHERPFVLFDGMKLNPQIGNPVVSGGATVDIAQKIGPVPNSNSLKWTMANQDGNGKNGFSFNFVTSTDLNASWQPDSLKFMMKTNAKGVSFAAQFESPSSIVTGSQARVGVTFTAANDTLWHEYDFPLKDMVPMDNTTGFDPAGINKFGILTQNADNSIVGKVAYISNLWTGNPILDVVPPQAPTGISVTANNDKTNTITWTDVPNQPQGTYYIYYSLNPIIDINDSGVEVAATGIGPTVQSATHVLRAPATDQNVTYYYAVVCKSGSLIMGSPGSTGSPTTNMAKGVPTINWGAPANFNADADLSEWTTANIRPIRLYPSDGSGTVVQNTYVPSDTASSADIYLAADKDYLYIACHVNTNNVFYDINWDITGQSWLNTSVDMFLGTYDWHGTPHASLETGAESDYQIRFCQNHVHIDNIGGVDSLEIYGPNYAWNPSRFPDPLPGYNIEARISWDDLAHKSDNGTLRTNGVLVPQEGMRIPIDFELNTVSPGANQRDGQVDYSPIAEGNSWTSPSLWTYTWIGNKWFVTGVNDNKNQTISTYQLFQNYPNPFNPTTQIQYTLMKPGKVSLKVYDILGRLVTTLIDGYQNQGTHEISFNASKLASGVYFYKLQAGDFQNVKKMMLLK